MTRLGFLEIKMPDLVFGIYSLTLNVLPMVIHVITVIAEINCEISGYLVGSVIKYLIPGINIGIMHL